MPSTSTREQPTPTYGFHDPIRRGVFVRLGICILLIAALFGLAMLLGMPGWLASVIGVLLWPLSLTGWLGFYPLEAHTRLMITGFAGCLVVGFAGTAGPRFLGAESWSRFELIWHFLH